MNSSKIKKKIYTTLLGSYRSLAYDIFSRCHHSMPVPLQDEPVDIVIPIIEKDLATLPLCIQGIQECIPHLIGKIYLVAPQTDSIVRAATQLHLTFVDEKNVLGYSPRDLHIITQAGVNRSGWIFQQLLKLSGNIGENRFFIVIDADHILLRPHTFLSKTRKTVFYQSKEYYYPYYENIQKLLGHYPFQQLSYIAHKMVFDKKELRLLKTYLEQRNRSLGMTWDQIIINSLNTDYISSFSEFELYGHFIHKSNKIRLPWKQKELFKQEQLPTYESLLKEYSNRYWSVTFPDYKRKS